VPIAQRQEYVVEGTQVPCGFTCSAGVSSAREVDELSVVYSAGGFPVVPIVGGLVIVVVVALIVWAVRASAKPK
jgi:cobalamin biosynthesis Mg chelatase CobN